jgi:hypothetical protein
LIDLRSYNPGIKIKGGKQILKRPRPLEEVKMELPSKEVGLVFPETLDARTGIVVPVDLCLPHVAAAAPAPNDRTQEEAALLRR